LTVERGGMSRSVSIDEVFDSFQEIDVDASGKVSKRELERYLAGSDIQHTFIVIFGTVDTGITWGDGADGSVVISMIEPGSPASDNGDIVVGLAIASVNGSALPPGGANMLRKVWRTLLAESHIALEFYEPFIIVHDFAHTLDLEVDTSRKKQVQKGRSTNGTSSKPPKHWSKFLSKLHQGSSTQRLDSSFTSRQLQVVTASLDTRAYAFAHDVVEALGDALFVAAPNYFRHESAVSSNEGLGR